jgi:hypothetical protein
MNSSPSKLSKVSSQYQKIGPTNSEVERVKIMLMAQKVLGQHQKLMLRALKVANERHKIVLFPKKKIRAQKIKSIAKKN